MPELQFQNITEFLTMRGYGLYVWLAYFLFMLFLVANTVQPMLRKKKIIAQIKTSIRILERDRKVSEG
ncbi:MAG: heme exporter protein CcmD [Bacteroidota bacterium]